MAPPFLICIVLLLLSLAICCHKRGFSYAPISSNPKTDGNLGQQTTSSMTQRRSETMAAPNFAKQIVLLKRAWTCLTEDADHFQQLLFQLTASVTIVKEFLLFTIKKQMSTFLSILRTGKIISLIRPTLNVGEAWPLRFGTFCTFQR